MNNNHPHQAQPTLTAGVPLALARAVLVLLHGRGATAASILPLAQDIGAADFAVFAPQAADNTWYPYRFMEPIASNEPSLTAALQAVGDIVAQAEAAGIAAERIIFGGFSQGACLAAEYVARHARRYGGLLVFSGGLIGPDGTPRDYAGTLDNTPIFIGCDERDFHIPASRVHETSEVLSRMGGSVTERLYSDMGHTINDDEIDHARAIVAAFK